MIADAVLDWLLDGDPAIRWQALRDLTDAPADEVAAERARVATEGWGARLLALQDDEGRWGGAPDERVAEAVELVASKRGADGRWRVETRYPGAMPVEVEVGEGQPSRWVTLSALRVLDWTGA